MTGVIYHGFPKRLHHVVPHWIKPGALFHICVALDREKKQRLFTEPVLALRLLDSAKFYEDQQREPATFRVLTPDHLHANSVVCTRSIISRIIGDWKRFATRKNRVVW